MNINVVFRITELHKNDSQIKQQSKKLSLILSNFEKKQLKPLKTQIDQSNKILGKDDDIQKWAELLHQELLILENAKQIIDNNRDI